MKTILLLLCLAMPVVISPACSTPPAARTAQVHTLKAVGQSAEAAVTLAANLYQQKTITDAQARQVIDFYDQKFQPVYRVAVMAARANLDSAASPDLVNLATEITMLVVKLQRPSP